MNEINLFLIYLIFLIVSVNKQALLFLLFLVVAKQVQVTWVQAKLFVFCVKKIKKLHTMDELWFFQLLFKGAILLLYFYFFYWNQFCLLLFFLMNLNLYFFNLFIYRSSVLSQSRGKELTNNEDEDPLLTPSDLSCGTYTSSCGHVMHADCWQRLETFLSFFSILPQYLFIYIFIFN